MADHIKRFPRGSEWRKWDLHVHTPASIINGFGDWNSYIKKLSETTRGKNIKVLGITDYFLIDGYEEILTKYKNSLEHIQLFLPNIELRLDHAVCHRETGEESRLNFHVIFKDEESGGPEIEDIKTQFIGDLSFYRPSEKAAELSEAKLTRKAIEDCGKEWKEKDKQFRHLSDLEVGFNNVFFKLDEVVNALRNKPKYFRGQYLLFLESAFWSDISWGKDYALRSTLLQASHGVFSSNPDAIRWFLGKDRDYYSDQQDLCSASEKCIVRHLKIQTLTSSVC